MQNSVDKTITQLQSIQTTHVIGLTKRKSVIPVSSRQCRICLQNQNQSMKELITPCRCIGSVQCVHKTCLQEWITKSLKKQILREVDIEEKILNSECQMCKFRIPYRIQLDNIISCASVSQRIKNNLIFAVILIMMIASILASLSYLICYAISKRLNFSDDKTLESSIIVASCVFLLIFLIIGVYLLLSDFVLAKKIIVSIVKPSNRYLQRSMSLMNPEIVVQELN